MILMNPKRECDIHLFATEAADDFRANPRHYTFSKGDPKAEALLAVRWNEITVLVLRLDEMEPRLYRTADLSGGSDLPPLKGWARFEDETADHARVVELERANETAREDLHAILGGDLRAPVSSLAHLVERVRLNLKAHAETIRLNEVRGNEEALARREVHALLGYGPECRPQPLQEGLGELRRILNVLGALGLKLERGAWVAPDGGPTALRRFLDLDPSIQAGLLELAPIAYEIRHSGKADHDFFMPALGRFADVIAKKAPVGARP